MHSDKPGFDMKKNFALAVLFFTIHLIPWCAQAQSATLFLSGTVTLLNTAVITPLPESQSLNILEGEKDRLVARVTETSNSPRGYRILASSENGSKLIHTTDKSAFVPYTLSYGGAPSVQLANFNQEVKRVPTVEGMVTNTSEVRVTFDKQPQAPVGTYTDTVSISISAD
jgi:hypothetical protein